MIDVNLSNAILEEALEAAFWAVQEIAHEEGTRGLDCGFAWVSFPANTSFGRGVKSHPLVGKGYPTGLQVWNPGRHNGQSIHIIEAGARAFNATLARHNIVGTVGSRYD
jgi:hypothetical protein